MFVKICGTTTEEDALLAIALGTDYGPTTCARS
jgi:phosphoribosylanthranilate isomerase